MSYATQLADYVRKTLAHPRWRLGRRRLPRARVLAEFFETAYAVSLKTEEEQQLRCTLALMSRWFFLDWGRERRRPGAVRCHPFGVPMPESQLVELLHWLEFTPKNLAKLAQAADPTVSVIAVGADHNDRLVMFGLFDQVLHYSRFLRHEGSRPPAIPGELLCTIDGPGRLTVYRHFQFVAALDQVKVVKTVAHPLAAGPLRKLLAACCLPGLDHQIGTVAKDYAPRGVRQPRWLRPRLVQEYLNTVARIVAGIQRYGHGGALLITTDTSAERLKFKYRIDYGGVSRAFGRVCRLQANRMLGFREGHTLTAKAKGDGAERGRALEHFWRSQRALEPLSRSRSELDAAIAFAASLSRVDGLVLCDPFLNVVGFGVELLVTNDPPALHVARNAFAKSLASLELTSFGTRHRSMMRYCWAVPLSIGFVVSQDGDIRVMARLNDKLIMWDRVDIRQLWLGQVWA